MRKSEPMERRSIWRIGPESNWTTIVPVGFIILSLLSLLVLPVIVSSKTRKMRGEITLVAEPAHKAANEIQMDLSSELDKLIAYQVTYQEQYRRGYDKLLQRQEEKRRRLSVLLPELDEDMSPILDDLFSQTKKWHESVKRGEFLTRELPNEVFLSRLFESHAAFESSLAAASQLELELQSAIESRQQRIRDADRLNFWVMLVLTLPALTSALLVAGLGRQMRLLAREATARRQEAEREANEAQARARGRRTEERRTAFLAAAGQEIAASLDYEETIVRLARLMVPNLAEMCAIDIHQDDGGLRRAAAIHMRSDPRREAGIEVGACAGKFRRRWCTSCARPSRRWSGRAPLCSST